VDGWIFEVYEMTFHDFSLLKFARHFFEEISQNCQAMVES
jgi:hypothetical protein